MFRHDCVSGSLGGVGGISPVIRTSHSTPPERSFSAAREDRVDMSMSWVEGVSGGPPGESRRIPMSVDGSGGGGGGAWLGVSAVEISCGIVDSSAILID